jgi:hypothetical protein
MHVDPSSQHVFNTWGTEEEYTGLWWGDLREGDDLEGTCIDGRIILKMG